MTAAKQSAALPLAFTRNESGDLARGLGTVRGAAIIWGDVARLGRGAFALREQFKRGALTPYNRGVIASVQHDRSQLLAQYPNGGLRLDSRDRGYFVEIDLPDTTVGRDAAALIDRGALRGLSIEFVDEKIRDRGHRDIVIERATITGVSIVDRPAYPQSEIEFIQRWLDAPPAKPSRRSRWL